MRTTLDIDGPVLKELKRLQRRQDGPKRSLGKLASELLTEALARNGDETTRAATFEWISKPMSARIELDDDEAIWAELEREV